MRRQGIGLIEPAERRSNGYRSYSAPPRRSGALERRIGELNAMQKALADLVKRCRGDLRPDCPILEDLEDAPRH